MNDSVCADPGTQGQLPTMGGAFRCWRRAAESNGHPCGAPVFQAGRDPHPRALQTDGCGRRNRTPIPKERRYSRPVADHPPAPAVEHRVRIELTMSCSARQPLRQLASGANCWRGTRDSNPVGTGLESVALPVESCPPWCAPPDWNRHLSQV